MFMIAFTIDVVLGLRLVCWEKGGFGEACWGLVVRAGKRWRRTLLRRSLGLKWTKMEVAKGSRLWVGTGAMLLKLERFL